MKEYLKRYILRLETLGPVFIGSGKKITKKEYIHDTKNKIIHIPNLAKMYNEIREMGFESEYEAFIMDERFKDLKKWLFEHRISEKTYMNWVEYSLDCSDIEFNVNQKGGNKKNNNREIQAFIKDAYGKPYVPASSVKGMLITLVLSNYGMNNADNRLTDRIEIGARNKTGRNRYLRAEIDEFENSKLYILEKNEKKKSDGVNDIFRNVRISDSKPLEISDLIVCQKVDYPQESGENLLPTYRECIKPGTIIEFELNLIEEKGKIISEDFIIESVKNFSKMYDECFRSEFMDSDDRLTSDIVFLGGGSGFVTKTVVYPLLGKKRGVRTTAEIFKNTLSKDMAKTHDNDVRNEISPHMYKMTYYDNKAYEMGKCRISIKEFGK